MERKSTNKPKEKKTVEKRAVFDTDVFNRMMDATKGFVAPAHAPRELQKLVRFRFSVIGAVCEAAACDGVSLSFESGVCQSVTADFDVLLPPSVKLPKKKTAEIHVVSSGGREEAVIRCGDVSFGYMQPAHPEWFKAEKEYIPTGECSKRIGFNPTLLLRAITAAKASCGGTIKNACVLEIRGESDPILLTTESESVKMIMPIRVYEQEDRNKKRRRA